MNRPVDLDLRALGPAWSALRKASGNRIGPIRTRAQYERIRCPVLVLTGTEPDQWNDLPVAARDARLAAIPDVRHHQIAGAGHYVHIEQPDTVLVLVAEFFGS